MNGLLDPQTHHPCRIGWRDSARHQHRLAIAKAKGYAHDFPQGYESRCADALNGGIPAAQQRRRSWLAVERKYYRERRISDGREALPVRIRPNAGINRARIESDNDSRRES